VGKSILRRRLGGGFSWTIGSSVLLGKGDRRRRCSKRESKDQPNCQTKCYWEKTDMTLRRGVPTEKKCSSGCMNSRKEGVRKGAKKKKTSGTQTQIEPRRSQRKKSMGKFFKVHDDWWTTPRERTGVKKKKPTRSLAARAGSQKKKKVSRS